MAASEEPLTYRSAGVDIDAGEALVRRIAPAVERTRRPEVLTGLGGFGALFEFPLQRYRQPVLVAGTDGVGTKLKLALALGRHDTIGVDLVAMCVNDLIVQGAEPLFFLDYYATARLDVEVASAVVQGIAHGCELAGAALVGGETAEMPGIYAAGDYDLAGFCVGVVEKGRIIDGSTCTPGDALVGLASSGPHSNGYSLIRKILERCRTDLQEPLSGDAQSRTIGEALLAPTRIYAKPLLEMLENTVFASAIKGVAHITGGGIVDNLPRVLPAGLQAVVRRSSWDLPRVFDWLRERGRIEDKELLRTFNCGVGMVLVVDPTQAEDVIDALQARGESAWSLGVLEARTGPARVRFAS